MNACRYCGAPAPSGAVDHLIPRRLLLKAEVLIMENLATLCAEGGRCHAHKTQVVEPRLYRGDVLSFAAFLAVVGRTGPVPDAELKAKAYERLREWIEQGGGR